MKTFLRSCAVLALVVVATAGTPQGGADEVLSHQAAAASELQATTPSTTAMLLLSDIEMVAVQGAGGYMDSDDIEMHCRAYTAGIPGLVGRIAMYKACVFALELVF